MTSGVDPAGITRAPDAGRGLCRSNRRLPLYGVSPADTGAVPTSAGQVGCMATDGSRLPMLIDQPEFCNDPCERAPHNGRRNTKCSAAREGNVAMANMLS